MVVGVGLRFAAVVALLLPAVVLAAETADLDALAKSLDARQLEEVQARAQTLPRSLERDTVWVTAVVLQKGAEAGVSFVATLVPSEKERPAVLAGATLRCLRLREYDAAAKLMRVVMEREPSMKKQERMGLVASALFTGLRRYEELGIARSDPRHPVVRLLAIGCGVSNDHQGVYAREFGSLPDSVYRGTLRAPMSIPEMGLRDFVLPPGVVLDIALAISDFNITGDPAVGWRVRLTTLDARGGLDNFVVLEGDEARILGGAGERLPPVLWGLGKRAAALVEAGDLAEARQWIEWARESLRGTRDTAWARFFVASTPEAITTADGLRTAADALASTGSLARLAGASPRLATGAPVVPAAVLPAGVLTFSDRMTRPKLQSSPNGQRSPDYPEDARASLVTGLVIVRCTITEKGTTEDCTIVKPLFPSLDREVLDWLGRSTWSPITLDGQPRRVSYVFNFNFMLQQPVRPPADR